jgi:hypothetical protein
VAARPLEVEQARALGVRRARERAARERLGVRARVELARRQ